MIKLIRIDDRLIHGQVVTAWIKSLSIKRLWIIDDDVVKDEFIVNVMQIVSPPGVDLIITGTNEITTLIKKYDSLRENTMILIRIPEVAEKIFTTNIKLRELNIGGMGVKQERRVIYKNTSISKDEEMILLKLVKINIKVYFCAVPGDKKIVLQNLIKNSEKS